jgi:hypothetical protein
VAVVAFYAADEDERISWSWLARDTVGGAPWPDDLSVPDRFFELALPERPMVELDDRQLVVAKKGGVLLDGRPLARPVARSGVVHLVQVIDKKGAVVDGSLQLGADFAEVLLEDGSEAVAIDHLPSPPPPLPLPDPDAVVDAPPPEPSPEANPEPEPEPEPEPIAAPVPEPEPARPVASPPSFSFSEAFPDCPWKAAPRKARVEGMEVVVNRQRHPVRSRDDVAATQRIFRQCGEFRAARRLGRWSEERRKLLSSGAEHRDAMLRVLVADEPTRSKNRRAPPTEAPDRD